MLCKPRPSRSLRLVEDRHTRSLGERLHYAQLADPAPTVEPVEPSQDAGAGQAPPPDRDGLIYNADLLTLAGNHPDGEDPAPNSVSDAVDAADAESASRAALRRADPTGPPTGPTTNLGSDLDPEETR